MPAYSPPDTVMETIYDDDEEEAYRGVERRKRPPVQCDACPELIERIHSNEERILLLERRDKEICERAASLAKWVDAHDLKSAELLRDAPELHSLAEGKRAASIFNKAIAWLIGAVVSGGLMIWHTWKDWHQ